MEIHTHVDDLLVAMDTSSTHAKEVLQKMKASLHLKGSDGRSFVYLARTFTITDEKITVSQAKAAANLEMVFVDKEHRSKPNSPFGSNATGATNAIGSGAVGSSAREAICTPLPSVLV